MVIVIRKRVQRNPERVQRDMEEVFRSILAEGPRLATRRSGNWRPSLEVYETSHSLVIVAELAGVDEETLVITADAEMVTIKGERIDTRSQEYRRYRESGIAYGPFSADIYLPFAVDVEQTVADYERGLLQVDLPRQAPVTIDARRSQSSASS